MKGAIILLAVLGLIACEKQNILTPSDIGKNLTVSQGDAKAVRDLEEKFSVKVLEIVDYRCPMGVYCLAIWQGGASVKFEIGSNEFSLALGQSKEFAVDQRNYKITLKDVVPYPVYQDSQVKQAVFVIEKI